MPNLAGQARLVTGDNERLPSRVGYARVSTLDQNPALQIDALTAAGCVRIFTDHASGTRERRPQLDATLDYLRPGDVLTVWRLDRLGRSMQHLTTIVNDLAQRDIQFCSITEGFDTTTPGGKLVFHMFAALAEFERAIIVERTRAGLDAARARGKLGGRKPKVTPSQITLARKLRDAGEHSVEEIAALVGVSRATIYRHLAAVTV